MGISFLGRWFNRSRNSTGSYNTEEQDADPVDAVSQFELGKKFADGKDVDQDNEQAVGWYLKAANQNHHEAQFKLGVMYGRGEGVTRDEGTAMRWLRREAESGHVGAQYNVGVKEHRASKSSRDGAASECRIEAFKWLQLATTASYRNAESALVFVSMEMTREEVGEGGRRAAAFSAQPKEQQTSTDSSL